MTLILSIDRSTFKKRHNPHLGIVTMLVDRNQCVAGSHPQLAFQIDKAGYPQLADIEQVPQKPGNFVKGFVEIRKA